MLYSDGTLDHAAGFGNGTYDNGVLACSFADEAFISAPSEPVSATVGGKPVGFGYSEEKHLVTVRGSGKTSEAAINFRED